VGGLRRRAGGSHVRKGDILCVVDTHDEVLVLTGRFMQYYRENARYLEDPTTGDSAITTYPAHVSENGEVVLTVEPG